MQHQPSENYSHPQPFLKLPTAMNQKDGFILVTGKQYPDKIFLNVPEKGGNILNCPCYFLKAQEKETIDIK